MSSEAITFSGLALPDGPDNLNARGQTFYSGPTHLLEAIGVAVAQDEAAASTLASIEAAGGDWGVMVTAESLSLTALIRTSQANRMVIISAHTPEDGLTQVTYGVDDAGAASLESFGNRFVSSTRQFTEPLGPVSVGDRLVAVGLGIRDFAMFVTQEVEVGRMYSVDPQKIADFHTLLQASRVDPELQRTIRAVIGLHGIARLIEEARADELVVNIIGDDPFGPPPVAP